MSPVPPVPAKPADSFTVQPQGGAMLEIDRAQSLVTVRVRAAGPLAPLGHEHLVALRALHGVVAPDAAQATVFAPLDGFTVDEPGLRSAAGMGRQPDAEAVAATRANMLDKVLDARRFPTIAARLYRRADDWRMALTIRGVTRDYAVAPLLEAGGSSARARGQLAVRQSDFGIEPFSALGGMLRVEDLLEISFDVSAVRAQKKAGPG